MKKPRVITADEAVKLIEDGSTIATCSFFMTGAPEEIWENIGKRYEQEQHPKDLTLVWASGVGDGSDRGFNHLCHEGQIKRVMGGHFGRTRKMYPLIAENKIEAYNIPQGAMCQMYRAAAAGTPFAITRVGLGTFVDPDFGGGRLNDAAKEDIVTKIEIDGEQFLKYKAPKIDYAILRGTEADENGNISFRKEALSWESLSVATAARNAGGKIIVQVEQIVKNGAIEPKDVKIPCIMVDYVVVASDPKYQWMTQGCEFDEAYISKRKYYVPARQPAPDCTTFTIREIIGRRGAMALEPADYVLNFGVGVPESVAAVMNYENINQHFISTIEPGIIGGLAQGGTDFGSSKYPEAIIDEPYQFDFYDGGGIDCTFLGLAEVNEKGSINVSRFGPSSPGCGGFINISQNAKKVVFCGSFTAKGLEIKVENKKLKIVKEGTKKKFVKELGHLTFNGEYEAKKNKKVLYLTERAVFELTEKGLMLTEIAPGIDMEKDILAHMEFKPLISDQLKIMDERIFSSESLELAQKIEGKS